MAPASMDKKADLAGPGISTYPEVEKILPDDYSLAARPRRRRRWRSSAVKRYIEDNLCKELNLIRCRGAADRRPRERRQRLPRPRRLAHADRVPVRPRPRQDAMDAQVVQAATKWKRMALKQFGCNVGRGHLHRHAGRAQGLLPRSRPQRLRRPVGLGARHHRQDQRNLDFLKDVVRKIWKVIKGAENLRPATCSPS